LGLNRLMRIYLLSTVDLHHLITSWEGGGSISSCFNFNIIFIGEGRERADVGRVVEGGMTDWSD
jgi:hypothetical protein